MCSKVLCICSTIPTPPHPSTSKCELSSRFPFGTGHCSLFPEWPLSTFRFKLLFDSTGFHRFYISEQVPHFISEVLWYPHCSEYPSFGTHWSPLLNYVTHQAFLCIHEQSSSIYRIELPSNPKFSLIINFLLRAFSFELHSILGIVRFLLAFSFCKHFIFLEFLGDVSCTAFLRFVCIFSPHLLDAMTCPSTDSVVHETLQTVSPFPFLCAAPVILVLQPLPSGFLAQYHFSLFQNTFSPIQ